MLFPAVALAALAPWLARAWISSIPSPPTTLQRVTTRLPPTAAPSFRTTPGLPARLVGAAGGALAMIAVDRLLGPTYLPAAVVAVLLAHIDLLVLRLPDPLVAGLGVALALPIPPAHLPRALLGAAVFGAAHLALALLPGDGLGLGDVKLAAVLGLPLGAAGWDAMVWGAALPHVLAFPVALVVLIRRGRRHPMPFGPALLAGAGLALALIPP